MARVRFSRFVFSLCLFLGIVLLGGCIQGQARDSSPLTQIRTTPALPAISSPSPIVSASTPVYHYRVVKVYPHDPESFTEGLAYANGWLYESCGLYGYSNLRQVNLETGEANKIYNLPDSYFAEGIALYQNSIVQLTWESKVGFVYDIDSFGLKEVFSYNGEGWGLAFDGERLIMSDGSSELRFLDPKTLQVAGSLEVSDNGEPVSNLNELEYVDGQIYANVWQTDKIAIIDPQTGKVSGRLDMSGLLQESGFQGEADVLNGIAYDSLDKRLFVTGKLWPSVFEIKVVK